MLKDIVHLIYMHEFPLPRSFSLFFFLSGNMTDVCVYSTALGTNPPVYWVEVGAVGKTFLSHVW